MILTVTPAPAIDWTAQVDSFDWGAVNRITSSSKEPSGKGLNVSWALHRAGVQTTAVFPGGGATARFMTAALAEAGLGHVLVPTDHDIRTNLTLITPGEATKINEASPPLTEGQADALVTAVLSAADHAEVPVRAILVCGSHPRGFGAEHLSRLVTGARERGIASAVDSSGAALEQAVELAPDLIKPNVHELANLTGRQLRSVGDVVEAAREIGARGPRAVLASLGADGALHVTEDSATLAVARGIPFANSVGAGDALLAGFVAQPDANVPRRLEQAVLWASSAVACTTTLFPVREEFRQCITVTDWIGEDVQLTEPAAATSRP